METKRVLLIDDSAKAVNQIKSILSTFPISYYQAGSEFGLFNTIEPYGKLVDLIVFNTSTKNLDPISTINKLKSNSRYSNIPVVIISDIVNKELVISAKSLRVDAVVKKPLDDGIFRSKIEVIFSGPN